MSSGSNRGNGIQEHDFTDLKKGDKRISECLEKDLKKIHELTVGDLKMFPRSAIKV